MNIKKNPKLSAADKKIQRKILFMSIISMLTLIIMLAAIFATGQKMENLIFYSGVPLSDGSSQVIMNCIYFCVPSAILFFAVVNFVAYKILLNKEKIKENSEKRKSNFPVKQMRFTYHHGYKLAFGSLILVIILGSIHLDAVPYIKGMFTKTPLYEQKYVAPEVQNYQFPEKKKNLIYIFLESMETSYASVEEGGLMKENYIPYLTQLTKEEKNISFSDTDTLGGAFEVTGTGWTVASMVSQTSGIPLTIPIAKLYFGNDDKFLPGSYSIGEVLENAGYNQMLMVGSKASFAKRKDYFEQHGNYEIFDYNEAIKRGPEAGYLPEDYYVWWGYEDQKLFEYAKIELKRLAQKDEPFNFTMLTVDTHFTDGYLCELCEDNHDSQYANVIRCSDTQLHSFLEWLKSDEFGEYEDTVIVITGDHLTMDHSFVENVDESNGTHGRRIYNCFINTGMSDEYSKNRIFTSMDMYPTTLAALGVSWGSNRLGLGVNLFSNEKTLCEEYGIDKVNDFLYSSSDFYGDHIIDNKLTNDELKAIYNDTHKREEEEERKKLEKINSSIDSTTNSIAE